MTALDRKINQLAARHGWSVEKQARAAVDCYIIDAATYEDAGKITAALLSSAPRAAAACPYKVGPLGRYIAPAIVKGMTATNENQIEVWCSDALDGDDWYFLVDSETDLRIFDRIDLVVDANGTPDDFSDDKVIDALYCHDCDETED